MNPKTKYEEEIIREIRTLPENLQLKLSRIVIFLKKEMMDNKVSELKATEKFLAACGKWKDSRSIEDQIDDIDSQRKSTDRTENLF